MAHAKLSPSSAERWMICPGSVALCEGIPDRSSAYADEGTAAHEMAEIILTGDLPAELNESMTPLTHPEAQALVGRKAENGVEFTQDMLTDVLKYTDFIADLVASTGGELHVEQKLPIEQWTREEGARGTADAVIITADELIVCDLKFGRGVEVSPENNKQLMIYALAALAKFGDEFNRIQVSTNNDSAWAQAFDRVRLIIAQPRIGDRNGRWEEWTLSVEALQNFGARVSNAAIETTRKDPPLVPSEKGCQFCRAKSICPALMAEVALTVQGAITAPLTPDDFDDLEPVKLSAATTTDYLSVAMSKVSMIESWCKALRAETETRLLVGGTVAGYKLVQGKMGNRKWSDAAETEALFKSLRLKVEEMYDFSLISPTTADKLAVSGVIGPRQWKKVLPLIIRTEGQPSVAPDSDKRPALNITAVADDFDILT